VAPPSADVSSQIAPARWLVSEGFHVAAPLADTEVIDGAKLSLWEFVDADPPRPIDFEQLGEIVARLHRIAPSRLHDVTTGSAAPLLQRGRPSDRTLRSGP
jgi:hypothetical protein